MAGGWFRIANRGDGKFVKSIGVDVMRVCVCVWCVGYVG